MVRSWMWGVLTEIVKEQVNAQYGSLLDGGVLTEIVKEQVNTQYGSLLDVGCSD